MNVRVNIKLALWVIYAQVVYLYILSVVVEYKY
jgi:hypothetical protein